MFSTMMISVPTGVKVFNWVATMWRGAMTFETPMLFAIGFVIMFTIGGLSGLMLAITPADIQYHDTYFVVAHFHYVLVPGAIYSLMAATYYWLPKWTGNMYDEKLGKMHFWISTVLLMFVYIIVKCVKGGEKATGEVWEGARGLEWTVPSPAPYHTFETAPKIEASTVTR